MERFKFLNREKLSKLPKNPGVYAFKKGNMLIYIGKAANLRDRVKQHRELLDQVKQLGYIETESEIEALILEANLIKKYQPKYNVVWRDDKNYFFIGITKEDFPRIFITHQPLKTISSKIHDREEMRKFVRKIQYVGPFVDGKALKHALKVLRRVFPYRSCNKIPKKPCLWYQLDLCPAPCLLKSNLAKEINLEQKIEKECQKNVKNLMRILEGKKKRVLKNLKSEMKIASSNQNYEKAAKIRNQIEALERVLAHAKIFEWSESQYVIKMPWHNYYPWKEMEEGLRKILKLRKSVSRIEAYDVSNIQGQLATGSMVTFIHGRPDKNFYRRFKIKIQGKPNDVAMLKEVLSRRFNHPEWKFPDLILIDGGIAQLSVALKIKNQISNLKNIKVMSLAKKENKLYIEGGKKPILLKSLPREIFNLILELRDEAHRFAISYHQKLRTKFLLEN